MASRKILIRRDTAANWTSANPTLSAGEMGGETDTGKLKLGNGATAWNSLSYLGGVTSVNGATGVVTGIATLSSPTFTGTVSTNHLIVGGDLTVSGTTTTVNTETIELADNVIVLNSNATGAPSENAGIEIERGSSTNVAIRWNETYDKWELTTDGTTYYNVATEEYAISLTPATLDAIGDVTITNAADGQFLKWNGSAWVNDPIDLATDTVGNYMANVSAGTGVSVTHTPGEGSTATIAIGQAVGTTSEVTFAGLRTTSVIEPLTISATAATGTVAVDAANGTTYYTTNASANWIVNLRWNSSTTLDTKLATGEMTTASFLARQGSTAYYPTSIQVNGTTSGVTTRWQGSTGAPTSGNANSTDMYTFTVVKTGSATFDVFAAQTRFS